MDTFHAFHGVMSQPTAWLWHKDHDLRGVDCVVLPGGFSYGDYLRSGAIARFSPLMQEVREFASKGGLVLGICNGFQVLLELGLLPGAMLRNKHLKFLCRFVTIRLENDKTRFTHKGRLGQICASPSPTSTATITLLRTLSRTLRKRPGRFPLRGGGRPPDGGGQCQRLAQRHRRADEQARQRDGHDAPSRSRRGSSGSAARTAG